MENLNSIKIIGEGVIHTGEYGNITICGEATSIGSFKCNYLNVLGTLYTKEESTAKNMKILGEVTSNGKFIVEDSLTLLGSLKAIKPCNINKFKILGQGKFKDILSFDDLTVLGELTSTNDCEGNEFNSKGKLKIRGLLSAENIVISLYEHCFINEICGSLINVKKGKWYSLTNKKLEANLIEGDTVVLENTNSKLVRGHNITILQGCNIEKVEYTGNITKVNSSVVKEEVCKAN